MDLAQDRTYTIEDIYALPDGQRAELIDGQIYDMAPPSTMHQRLSGRLYREIANYIASKHGSWLRVYGTALLFFQSNK